MRAGRPGARGGDRTRSAVAAAALSSLVLACASPLVSTDGGYRHREAGYTFAEPGPAWKRFDLEGAVIAYRAPTRETMSLRTTCGRPLAKPAIMARMLLIGIGPYDVLQSGPIEVAGRSGWAQHVATQRGEKSIHLHTVTLVASGCSYDWTLASLGESEQAEADFEAWWRSFRLPEGGASGDRPGRA